MSIRISTMSLYETAVNDFNTMQASIAKSINKISSGIKLTSPADNPTAAAQVLVATQASALNTQYGVNRQNANTALSTSDGVLAGVMKLMQSLGSSIVEAGSGALNESDRVSIAQELQSGLDQLLNLANSTDANGNYIFSGTAATTPPYAIVGNGAQYNGNQITQMLQVDPSQQLAVTVGGDSIFGNIQVSPNAYFGFANANNTATATISAGTVSNAAAVTNDTYTITFTSATTYDIKDISTGVTISTNNAYTSGAAITVGGMQFSITDGAAPTGVPAAGDQFTVQPGKQNIFQALTTVIAALKQPLGTNGDRTNLSNSLAQANTSIASSLDNVLAVRGQLGNSLQQITSLNNVGDTLGLAFQSTIEDLQNVNYAEAISQLAKEQFVYEAAQKAFASTSRLSLIALL